MSVLNLSLIVFNIHYYSPTLKIIVPNNYSGEINLVRSNIEDNILEVDNNGIGYVNEWTFKKTYRKPKVFDKKGNDLSAQLKGFNNLIFWTTPEHCCIKLNAVKSMNFEILPKNKAENTFVFFELTKNINTKIVKFFPVKRRRK